MNIERELVQQALEFIEQQSHTWNGQGPHPHRIVSGLRTALYPDVSKPPRMTDAEIEDIL